jgi:hypothetical protein
VILFFSSNITMDDVKKYGAAGTLSYVITARRNWGSEQCLEISMKFLRVEAFVKKILIVELLIQGGGHQISLLIYKPHE